MLSPGLSSAFSLQCRRRHGSTQASLPFYGRKMNCLPSSGAERDDRTESCHLLWFWQQQNRAFSPQPPLDGQCTPGIQQGKSKPPAELLPDAFLPCLARKGMCLFMNSVKPYFGGNALFTKQGIKKAICVLLEDLSRGGPENTVPIRSPPRNAFISLHNEALQLKLGSEMALLRGGAAAPGEGQPRPAQASPVSLIPVSCVAQRDGGVATNSR